MLFRKIADLVITHYKKFIVVWIVIFILSGYLAMLSSDIVVYEDTEMAPPDIESAEVDEVINKEFLQMPNSTAILVVQAPDISTREMTDLILDIEEAVNADSSPECTGSRSIKCFDGITTIYTVYREIIRATSESLGPTLYDLETNITGLSFMMYGLPYIYTTVHDGTSSGMNGTAFMVYGIPSSFVQARDGVESSAYLLYGVPSMFAQAWDGVNGSAMLFHGIPSMFAQAWDGVNGSALMMYGLPSMFSEAWYGVNGTALMLYGIPYMYQETYTQVDLISQLIYGGPAAYMGTWLSLSTVPNMTNRNQMAFDQSWAVLNSSIDDDVQRQLVNGYHTEFHDIWNRSFNMSSPYYLPNTTLPTDRAQAVVDQTAPTYFNFTVPVDQMQQFYAGVWDHFNITSFADPSVVNGYTNIAAWQAFLSQTSDLDLPPEQLAMLQGYYDAFAFQWNMSFYDASTVNLTASDRTQYMIDGIAASYIEQVSGDDLDTLQMMMGVLQAFDLSTWDQVGHQNRFTDSSFRANMGSMVGDLGLPPEMELQMWAFYDAFYQVWNGSFTDPSFDNMTHQGRAGAIVEQVTPGFIASAVDSGLVDEQAETMLNAVLLGLNITDWNDTARINSITNSTFYGTMQVMMGAFGLDPDMEAQIWAFYDLFYPSWVDTFGSVQGPPPHDTRERAELASRVAGIAYIPNASGGDQVTEELLNGVLFHFNGTTWNDTTMVNQFVDGTFSASLEAIASEMGIPSGQVEEMERYYGLFFMQWNASFLLPPLEGYSSLERAEFAAHAAAPGFIDEVAAGDKTVRDMMLGVMGGLNMDTWNVTMAIDALAYSIMDATIEDMGASMGLDGAMQEKVKDYLGLFFSSWNSSYSVPGLEDANGTLRAVWAIDDAIPRFTADLPAQEAGFITSVHDGLSYIDWNDTHSQEVLTNKLAYEGTLAIIDDLMLNMTGGGSVNSTMEGQVRGYLSAFYDGWNASFSEGSPSYIRKGTPALERGSTVVDRVAPIYFDFQVVDDDQSETMHDVWAAFGLGNWSDVELAHWFTIDLLTDSMTENARQAMRFDRAFFQDIYELGREPTDETLDAFVEDIMRSGTLYTYPVQISDSIVSQFVNQENDTMIIILGFNKGTGAQYGPKIERGLEEIGDMSRDLKKERGMKGTKVYVSGPAPLSIEMEKTIDHDIERIDIVTAIIVLILISLFFRSFVTSTIPLMSIGAAIVATFGMIFIVGSYFIQIHYTVVTLTFTALMGAGIDYCIFIVARYREERNKGKSVEGSIRTAVTWAGESITTSGLAVMIGFGGLSVLTFSMVQGMGVVLPIGIGIAILVALTFLPAFMMVLGDRIFWVPRFMRKRMSGTKGREKGPKRKAKVAKRTTKRKVAKNGRSGTNAPEDDGGRVFYFTSAVDAATKHAKLIVVLAILVSVPTSLIVYTLEPSYDFFTGMPETEAKFGIDAMADGFGKSRGMETKVIVMSKDPVYDQDGNYDVAFLDAIDALASKIDGHEAVKRSDPSTYSEGERIDRVDCWQVFGDEWKATCLQGAIGRDNNTVIITVVLKGEPFSKGSIESIEDIRVLLNKEKTDHAAIEDAKIMVGGATASMADIQSLIDDNMEEMRVIVVLGIFILLLFVLGSILIPVTAIVSVGLSISWTLAVTMLVFQFVKGQPVLWLMPIILFVVLMGLGMDYNIFIITRMREEVLKGYSDRVAIRRAVERTGGIITACGAIMAGAFGSMMLSSMGLLQQFGFALFFAILLDAFIVRIYLMPAIIVLLKKWNWWAPGRLQRVKRDENGRLIIRGQRGAGKGEGKGGRKVVRRSGGRVHEEE